MKINQLLICAALSGALLLAVDACTTKQPDSTTPTPLAKNSSFDQLQNRILTPSCASSGCHASEQDATFKQHGLVLTAGKSYDYLINKDPYNQNAIADKLKRVLPNYSLQSLLYHKLNFDPAGHHTGKSYGNPMPLGRSPLSVGQIEFVRRWIEAGAPKTGNVADSVLLDDKTPSYVENFVALAPPKAGEGIQMTLNTFDVAPNFEREFFNRKETGNTTDLYVNRVQIKMRQSSHHFILYSYRDLKSSYMPPFNVDRDIRNSDGTNNLLTILSMSNHVFWVGAQTTNHEYTFPEGTALLLPAGSSFDLNSHYVNKTTKPIQGEVYANLYTTPKSKVVNVVRALDLGNTSLDIPANKKTVISKTFTFTARTAVIMLTSHNHKMGEKFVIRIKGGARDGESVFESTDWEHPTIKNFDTPLILEKGQGLTSEITYNNTSAKNIKFGLTSEDEMGIIFGYYYELP
jgi:Copper type II ascorbate-dependent monooxygenase, C-terminal domain